LAEPSNRDRAVLGLVGDGAGIRIDETVFEGVVDEDGQLAGRRA